MSESVRNMQEANKAMDKAIRIVNATIIVCSTTIIIQVGLVIWLLCKLVGDTP